MNIITVEGGRKEQRQIVEDVVSYMIQRQMPRMRTLDIHVTLKKIADANGYCMSESKREFEIEIDKRLKKNEFISTVIHEMVHVWQGATGRIKDKFRGGYKKLWKCKDGKYRNYLNTAYEKQPWEVQAYKMQGPLTKAFMKEYGVK